MIEFEKIHHNCSRTACWKNHLVCTCVGILYYVFKYRVNTQRVTVEIAPRGYCGGIAAVLCLQAWILAVDLAISTTITTITMYYNSSVFESEEVIRWRKKKDYAPSFGGRGVREGWCARGFDKMPQGRGEGTYPDEYWRHILYYPTYTGVRFTWNWAAAAVAQTFRRIYSRHRLRLLI